MVATIKDEIIEEDEEDRTMTSQQIDQKKIGMMTSSSNNSQDSDLKETTSNSDENKYIENEQGVNLSISSSSQTADLGGNEKSQNKKESGDVVDSVDVTDLAKGPPSAKDSGYAWVILILVFTVNLVTAGNFKSFGITYTIILDYFPNASSASSGWILGLLMGCRCLLSPAMGALSVLIGPRKCVIIGSIICTLSFLLAVPAFSIEYMAFTLGGLFGAGMCMVETPGYILITDYFEQKRSFANGIRSSGNALGGVIFSPLVVVLHAYFGFQGAFIMMAGVMLQLVIVGMLMRSYAQQKKIVEQRYWNKVQIPTNMDPQIIDLKEQQQNQERKKKKPLDFTLFKNPSYLVYLIVALCATSALPNALFYLPKYGRTIGLSDWQNSFISSYLSLCDAVMRILCGWIFSYKCIKKTHGFIVGLLVGAAGCALVPFSGSLWLLLIAATMFSLCMGFFWTLINILLADQFGGESMASTWGFFRMVQGMCSFMYPPLIGFVIDSTGGMTAPYLLMGSLLSLAAFIFALQPLIAKLPGSKVNLL